MEETNKILNRLKEIDELGTKLKLRADEKFMLTLVSVMEIYKLDYHQLVAYLSTQ